MFTPKHLKRAAAVVAGTAIATITTSAIASPGSGVTATPLVTANFDEDGHFNNDRIKFQTKDPTDVRMTQLTFSAGGFSGWHHHPGLLLNAVASGLVTITDSQCNSKTYGPGSPNGAVFVEGGDEPIQASSTAGATVFSTTVTPDGQPARIEDAVPACATTTRFRVPSAK